MHLNVKNKHLMRKVILGITCLGVILSWGCIGSETETFTGSEDTNDEMIADPTTDPTVDPTTDPTIDPTNDQDPGTDPQDYYGEEIDSLIIPHLDISQPGLLADSSIMILFSQVPLESYQAFLYLFPMDQPLPEINLATADLSIQSNQDGQFDVSQIADLPKYRGIIWISELNQGSCLDQVQAGSASLLQSDFDIESYEGRETCLGD